MNSDSDLPCKCGHLFEKHHIIEYENGCWEYHDDLKEDVWIETHEPVPVCEACDKDCDFDQMNNLEFLEWKHGLRNSNS